MGCLHYAGCLDESVFQQWESFSCTHCPLAPQAEAVPRAAGSYAHERKGGRFD